MHYLLSMMNYISMPLYVKFAHKTSTETKKAVFSAGKFAEATSKALTRALCTLIS